MLILNKKKKLQILKGRLVVWNNDIFGNIPINVYEATKKLTTIQDFIQTSATTGILLKDEKIS